MPASPLNLVPYVNIPSLEDAFVVRSLRDASYFNIICQKARKHQAEADPW